MVAKKSKAVRLIVVSECLGGGDFGVTLDENNLTKLVNRTFNNGLRYKANRTLNLITFICQPYYSKHNLSTPYKLRNRLPHTKRETFFKGHKQMYKNRVWIHMG